MIRPRVLGDLANCGYLGASIEPVRPLDFADRAHRDPFDRQIPAQRDEAIDIPCVEALLCRPEVILLPHDPIVVRPPPSAATETACSRISAPENHRMAVCAS